MAEPKKTNVYHIGYTAGIKNASIFFWGCNFACQGCLCKKEIRNYLLKENWHLIEAEPKGTVPPPQQFLSIAEITQALDDMEVERVLLEGQEASLDPLYPQLSEALHKKFNCINTLCTNAYKIPNLKDTDNMQISIKAIDDSLHRRYTGKSNKKVLKNFVDLHKAGMQLTVSSVLIPGLIEADEMERVAKFIASVDEDIPLHILRYYKVGENPWRRPTPEEIDEAARLAKKYLNRVCGWRGDEEITHEMVRLF